jgi:homoserine kinase
MSAVSRAVRRTVSAEEAHRALDGRQFVVPASIANLGSGFDALAVAVQLYLRVRVTGIDHGPRNAVRSGFGAVALEGEDYVARSIQTLAAREGVDFPALDLDVDSDIPMQAGLGSSAAATVAGLRLYDALAGGEVRDLIEEGAAFEGHPDNIAAALLGGLATGCVCDDGRVLAGSVPWPSRVRFVAATPEARVRTPDARRVLPDAITRKDAIFNLQRVALLLQAVQFDRPELLGEALRDRWHQPYRAALVPGLAEALALGHPDLIGVCLAGSGPTVVGLVSGDSSGVEAAFATIYARLQLPCRIRVLAAHNGRDGAWGPRPAAGTQGSDPS